MLPEGKCRYIDGQIYPDGNFFVLDTEHIKHNGSELKSALNGINTDISNKVDKVAGKGLSTEDYTTAEKNKLSGIEANANDYVHPTTSGNKHIPSGGSSGKILGWSADGTAAWVDPTGGGGGDVSSVKVGSTTYNPDSSGIVSLPAYPTTLPASDVYSWAKASSKPSYTYSEVGAASSSHTHSGYVPTTRTINGYSLSSNRTLTYSDVGAASSGHTHSVATTSSSGFMSYLDKLGLIDIIDSGDKNIFNSKNIIDYRYIVKNGNDYAYKSSTTDTRTTFTFTISAYNGSTSVRNIIYAGINNTGFVSFEFKKTSDYNVIRFGHSGATKDMLIYLDVSNLINDVTYVMSFNVTAINPKSSIAFDSLMISEKSKFDVSTKFVPYQKKTVLKQYDLMLHNVSFTKSTNGLYYMSNNKDLSNMFSVIYSVTINSFDALENRAYLPAFDGTTLKLFISDPSAPSSISFPSQSAKLRLNVYGVEA